MLADCVVSTSTCPTATDKCTPGTAAASDGGYCTATPRMVLLLCSTYQTSHRNTSNLVCLQSAKETPPVTQTPTSALLQQELLLLVVTVLRLPVGPLVLRFSSPQSGMKLGLLAECTSPSICSANVCRGKIDDGDTCASDSGRAFVLLM